MAQTKLWYMVAQTGILLAIKASSSPEPPLHYAGAVPPEPAQAYLTLASGMLITSQSVMQISFLAYFPYFEK
jgi:hypothetical protein